ncbi:MAG: hypothetical protein NUV56_02710 [Candidatus Uhrbacteria bacterium]|nr:hypothetical protein [Candidatus Uhrbacteria bacterium]
MTRNLYRQHRPGRGGGAFVRGLSLVLLVGGGVALVLWAITWFRAQADAKIVASEAVNEVEQARELEANAQMAASAVMYDRANEAVGLLARSGTVELPSYEMVVRLPDIDTSVTSYGVWLLKQGLADVVFAGDLLPRADGSWSLTFSVADPLDYPEAVITLEPKDADPLPSGNRVAEGEFTTP